LPPLVLPVNPAMLQPVTAPRAPHPGFWWAVLWCLAFLFFTQIVPAIGVLAIVMLGEAGKAADPAQALERMQTPEGLADLQSVSLPYLLVTPLVCGVLMAWAAIRLIVGKDWKRRLAVRLPSASHVVLVLLGMPAVMVLGDVVHQLVSAVVPGFHAAEEAMKDVSDWPWWLAVLVIGLGPALGEELWCRGFLGRGLVGHYGAVRGIALTSLLFGLMHIDPPQAVAACALGVALHYAYLTTRSLLIPMLMHFLNNAAVALVSSSNGPYVPPLAALDRATANGPLVPGLTALLLLVVVGYALYASRARLVPLAADGTVSWQPAFTGVEYPPPGGMTIVVRPALTATIWGIVLIDALAFGLAVYFTSQPGQP
jgi:membrane protease YdiL (CAAX protease family)